MRWRAVVLALGVVAAWVAVPAAYGDVPLPDNDPFYAVPANVGGMANGAIIRSRSITATSQSIPLPATAWQVQYKTIDNTGAPTATVTTIMVPTAAWTGTGPRPVVSYQTAEDGVGTKCSPSYGIRAGLAAGATNSSNETSQMQQALLRGWTVVAPDYEGPRSMFLGAEGEARGVLDSLRAVRAFSPAGIAPSAPLALWGYSGGAFASSVAAQMQPRYAPELKLSGVALGGLVGDLRATIHAFSGSFAGGALVMGFVAVDRAYPEYHLTQYLNDAARAAMANSQTDCINDAAMKYPFARLEQYTSDPGIIDGSVLKPLFERINPLTFPGVPAAPVYDYHAVFDELAPIGPDRAVMDRFCRGGVPVQKVEDPVGEHISYLATGAPGALAYLGDRFAGKPAPGNCTVPPDRTASTGASSPRCLSIAGVVRDQVMRLPGGGRVVLKTRQVSDAARPLTVAVRGSGGARVRAVALKVNGRRVRARASGSAAVGVSRLRLGPSAKRNSVTATVTLTNGRRVVLTQFLVILRCHVPPASCRRRAGGRTVVCRSGTPRGGRRVTVTLVGTGEQRATGSARVKRGRYAVTLHSATALTAGTYDYKHTVTTSKPRQRYYMIRRVTVS